MRTRWLVRVGYDGTSFHGWARQPGLRTVEGELRAGLHAHHPGLRSEDAGLSVASRTDRGVSARANAFALHSELRGGALLRILNGVSPEILCTAAAPIDEGFRPRRAVRRTYRYYEPDPGSPDRMADAARLFRGPIDVRTFGRGIRSSEPSFREVESTGLTPVPGGLVIEVRARSFVWGMVRKMVGALREYGEGRVTLQQLRGAIRGETRLTLPLAAPDRLILWEVEYDLPWSVRWTGPNRHQRAWLLSARHRRWSESEVHATLSDLGPR